MRARNMQALTDDTRRRHPGVVIYGVGDAAHKLRTSDHNEDDTAGSRAAQSDADSNPEHRAIDIMLGAAFARAQANALVADLVADPAARVRLFYIIFDGRIWSRSNSWVVRDFDGADQHTDHIHVSGWAADDENAAPWPAVYGGTMADPKLDSLHAGHFYGGPDNGKGVLAEYANPKVASPHNNSDLEQWAELRGEMALLRADVTELKTRPPVQSAPIDQAALDAAVERALTKMLPAIGEAVVAATRAEYND